MGLPDGWRLTTVGHAGRLQLGRQRAPRYHSGVNMKPYLRVANVFEDRIDLSDLKSMQFDPEEFERYRLRDGDVLLNEGQTPELLGRPAIYREHHGELAFTNSLIRFQARDGVDPKWALLVFRHHMHSGRFKRESRITTNIAHLSLGRLRQVAFPVPPLAEQRRIVAMLEDHLSRLDVGISSIASNMTRLDQLGQSMVDAAFDGMRDPEAHAFRDRLCERRRLDAGSARVPARADIELLAGDVPWPIASLEEVTDPVRVIRYGILKPASETGDVPYVEVRDLRMGQLASVHLKRTSATLDQQFAGARLRGGDVVVAVRGSFERSAVVPAELEGSNISRDVVRLAPLPGINPAYIRYWYETSTNKRYLRRHARGVAVRGVNVGTLRALPVPVVSTGVQDRVVAQIDDGVAALERLRVALVASQKRADGLRRSLLAAAFEGRLTESASENQVREMIEA